MQRSRSPISGAMRRYRTMASVPMFEEMIVTGAWWDFVDPIATHQLGDVLRTDPARHVEVDAPLVSR